jgi:hypothetical protein
MRPPPKKRNIQIIVDVLAGNHCITLYDNESQTLNKHCFQYSRIKGSACSNFLFWDLNSVTPVISYMIQQWTFITRLLTGWMRNWGSIPRRGNRFFYFLRSIHISSGVPPVPYPVSISDSFSKYKYSGAWSWPQLVTWLSMFGAIPLFPHMSSWCGSQLRRTTVILLYFL